MSDITEEERLEKKIERLKKREKKLKASVKRLRIDISNARLAERRFKEGVKRRLEPFMGPSKAKLTLKQEMFCREYLASLNASDAYRKAYNVSDTTNDRFIKWKAKYLKDSLIIQKRLEELRRPILEKLTVSAEKTLRRLMQGQEFDIRKLYHEDGSLKMPYELDDDTAKAVVGVKHDKDGSFEYKIIDVKGCAELIGKHLKLFTDKVETDITGELTIRSEIPDPQALPTEFMRHSDDGND